MTHGRVTAQQTKGLLMWAMTHGVKGQGHTAGAVNTYYSPMGAFFPGALCPEAFCPFLQCPYRLEHKNIEFCQHNCLGVKKYNVNVQLL